MSQQRRFQRYTWKVENYFTRADSLKVDEAIFSPEFAVADPTGKGMDYRFKLKLYPSGSESNPESVGLFLHNLNTKTGVRVSYSLFLVDKGGNKVKERSTEDQFIKKSFGYGYYDFCSRVVIQSNTEKVVVSGAVTVGCDVKILRKFDADLGPGLGDDLNLARKSNIMTDLVLICGEQKFPCHKNVLAVRSKVFLGMFESTDMFENAENNDDSEVNIDGMEPHVMEKLLEFIYTNRVDLSEHSRELFVAADRFDIVSLKRAVECELFNGLSVDNVAEILMLFDTHNCDTEELEAEVLMYAVKNMSSVMKKDSFKKVVEEHPRLSMKFFKEIVPKIK